MNPGQLRQHAANRPHTVQGHIRAWAEKAEQLLKAAALELERLAKNQKGKP
jgi:hypothetical protein